MTFMAVKYRNRVGPELVSRIPKRVLELLGPARRIKLESRLSAQGGGGGV